MDADAVGVVTGRSVMRRTLAGLCLGSTTARKSERRRRKFHPAARLSSRGGTARWPSLEERGSIDLASLSKRGEAPDRMQIGTQRAVATPPTMIFCYECVIAATGARFWAGAGGARPPPSGSPSLDSITAIQWVPANWA